MKNTVLGRKISINARGLKQNVFLKNFSYVFAGNGLAMLIGLAFTPIFSRIYSPEAYGLFALYMSFTTVAGQFVTLQYPRAFVIPKEEETFRNLVRLSLFVVFFFSVAILLVLLFSKSSILHLFGAEKLGNWIFLIPAAILLGGINDIWRSWNIRVKEFKKGAMAKIVSTLFTRIVTLVYGLYTMGGSGGLLLGDFMSKPSDTILLQTKTIRKNLSVLGQQFSLKTVWQTAKEFRQYPLFLLPGTWLYNLILQLPPIFLSIYFTKEQVGYYSMTNSLFVLPMSLLTTALAPVFLQKITETYHTSPRLIGPMVKKLFWTLHITGLLPFSLLIVFGDKLMLFFLGKQWGEAGLYASVMGYYFIFSINSYVLNALYRVYKKEKAFLFINILMVILCIAGLWIGAVFFKNVYYSIVGFCIANTAGQLAHVGYNLRLSQLPVMKYLVLSVVISAIVILFFYLIRFLLY